MSTTLERAAQTLTWHNLASRWHVEHGSDFVAAAGGGWQNEDRELCDSEDAFRAMSDDLPLDVWETWYAGDMRASISVGADWRDVQVHNVTVDLADDIVVIFNGAKAWLLDVGGDVEELEVDDEMGIGQQLIWRFQNNAPTN